MLLDYINHKKGIVSYHFDTHDKDITYVQSISDKTISLVQKNKDDSEFNVIELPHYKGDLIFNHAWGLVEDKKNKKIQFYLIPKTTARKLEKEVIEIDNNVNYDSLINNYTYKGFIHYKTASLIYFTKLNKKDLKILNVTYSDVPIKTLNTRRKVS